MPAATLESNLVILAVLKLCIQYYALIFSIYLGETPTYMHIPGDIPGYYHDIIYSSKNKKANKNKYFIYIRKVNIYSVNEYTFLHIDIYKYQNSNTVNTS